MNKRTEMTVPAGTPARGRCNLRHLLVVALLAGAGPALAQQPPVIYPSEGQTMQQQASDEAACRGWAQQQSGFDPAMPPPSTGGGSSGGEVVRGAAGGALLGAVGGAIGGDTGKGVAIGAGVGATAGLMRKNRNNRAQRQADEQSVAAYNQRVGDYNRAFGACMQGRGYAVN
jgi:hypothetical protein